MGSLSLFDGEDFGVGGKVCTGCFLWKPLEEYHRQKGQIGDLKPKCKLCTKVDQAADHIAHKEERNQKALENYRKDPDSYKKRALKSYYADPEKAKKRVSEWMKNNVERRAEICSKWSRNNRDKTREYTRRRYALRRGAYTLKFTKADLDAKAAYWGYRCWVCGGKPDSWDHVKPLNKGGAHILANLRPICRVCNSSKKDTWPLSRLI